VARGQPGVGHSNILGKGNTELFHQAKAKNSFIGRLINHESQIVRRVGLLLKGEKWGHHIGGGEFSHMVAENAETPFDTI